MFGMFAVNRLSLWHRVVSLCLRMAGFYLLQTTKVCARTISRQLHLLQTCTRSMSVAKKLKVDRDTASADDKKEERLIWVDLEMTGLDIEKDKIIEIACLVTSGNLDLVAKGPNIVIHQPKDVMDGMNDWCQEHHGQSGLTQAVLESKVSMSEAEQRVLSFVQQHTDAGQAPLAGNSVYMDKLFLQKYMPSFVKHLHYRIVDVSTIKELCRRWYPKEFDKAPQKALSHRALDDIHESVKELQYYQQAIFK